MPLTAGARLGPFEIGAPLGQGGMGEVYRARDARLGRDVALKILPSHVASDPEWRARLEREARALSSLSHPHICHLYDIGHHDGIDFLVMEYLEGETLDARLRRGPLPMPQVLRHGAEIAAALQAAHRTGLVHRDLKPGNIMLTRAGARLLDFGLAKPVRSPITPGVSAATMAPLTTEGTVVGTSQYMSPEQVEGREADARSDIFALGAVLHEMATGARAFDGRSAASAMAAVLERDPPPVSSLQPLAPAALDDVVRGCLAKDPDDRWQTAHDVKLQLETLARRVGAASAVPPRRRRWVGAALLGGLLLVAALAAVAGRVSAPRAEPGASLRASILPPGGHSFAPHDFAISPDGRRLAFVATGADGAASLWVQALDAAQPTQISGSAGAVSPFWSPDSRAIAFFTRDKLATVEPGGRGVQVIADVTLYARGGAWSPSGAILFSNSVFGPLVHVSADGGTPVPVTRVPADAAGEAHRFPQFLPDGRRFLYVKSWTAEQRGGAYLASLDDSEPRLVSPEIRGRMQLVGEHLLFLRDGILYAQPFDTTRGELTGTARPVIRGELATDWRFGDVPLSASSTGVLVYQSRLTYHSRLVWYDRNGRELGQLGAPGSSAPTISPDGRWVATALDSAGSGQQNIWVHDLQRGIATRVTTEGTDTAHAWSGDGHWLVYSSMRAVEGVFRRPVDGSGIEETLVESQAHLLVNDSSRDGSRVVYMDFSEGLPQLRALDLASRQRDTLGPGAEAVFSPDGRWLAFLGFPVGTLFVMPADGRAGGGRVQISAGAGAQARWRGDGKEIFFIGPDKKMMAAPIAVRDGRLEPGTPVPLFQTRIVQPRLVLFQYDVTADGQRFLINSLPREDSAAPLTVLTHWMDAVH
jgi:eukaryotic-like serine/threonine-protein kinase